MNRIGILITASALALSACSKTDTPDPEPEYPVRTEIVDGIETIANPAYPRDGIFKYDLVEEYSIGEDTGSGEALLNRPIHLQIDTQDYLYVMDWGDTDIKVFNRAGEHTRTIGKKGQGPGEFNIPADLRIGEDGRIYLLDSRQNRISILNLDGSYISGFTLGGSSYEFDIDADFRIYIAQYDLPEVKAFDTYQIIERNKTIYRVDENGENRFEFGSFPQASQRRRVVKTKTGLSSRSSQSREAYTTVWFTGPNHRLYMGYNRDYKIKVFDMEYNLLYTFGREFFALKHPLYTPESAHPEFYPAFYDRQYFFDDDDNLWLRQYTAEEDVELGIYDVFSPDGIYVKQVHLPHPLYKYRNGKAYTILRTEEDFLVVRCFRLVALTD
jgi:hypothetical protein